MVPGRKGAVTRRVAQLIASALAVVVAWGASGSFAAADQVYPGPTPRANCGPGSHPETGRQGRLTVAGVPKAPFFCNMQLISHYGVRGGYKVERYVDKQGHECAIYDSTLLFPKDAVAAGQDLTGAYVLDMTDPAHPVHTTTLVTPAMQSPHESMGLNQKRGLLMAVTGNPAFGPPSADVYDVTTDCRHPALQSITTSGLFGHEGNWAPDGKTYYSAGWYSEHVVAVDVSNPTAPVPLWVGSFGHQHGLSISDDGKRAYMATEAGSLPGAVDNALTIVDTSTIQSRGLNPQVPVVSVLNWPSRSTPQASIPVTIQGHKYLIEFDEFGGGSPQIGAARIIDIADDVHPRVVSNIKLEVNMPQNQADQAGDPGATALFRGYGAHYCEVPQRDEPNVLACTFILSGLRFFDIRDPFHPREIGYYNPVPHKSIDGSPDSQDPASNFSMSKPAFVPSRNEIWFTDGNSGFYALRLTNGAGSIVPGAPRTGPYVVGDNTALTASTQANPNTSTGRNPLRLLLALALLLACIASAGLVGRRPARGGARP